MIRLSEKDVTAQVKGFMEARGWRRVRMSRGVSTFGNRGTVTFGEPGMADWLFIRYWIAGVIWIEIKAPGKTAKCRCATKKPLQRCTACDQAAWKAAEIARGAVVWTIDSLEALERAYANL